MQFNWKYKKNYESTKLGKSHVSEEMYYRKKIPTMLLPFTFGLNVGQIKCISPQRMLKISAWVFEFLFDLGLIFSTHLQNI